MLWQPSVGAALTRVTAGVREPLRWRTDTGYGLKIAV